MKKIKNILFLIVTLLTFGGCQELTRDDYNQIYPENFFQNESDVKNATTSLYSLFAMNSYGGGGVYSFGRGGYNIFTEVSTDIMDCQWGDGGSWASFNEHRWTAENTIGTDGIYWKYNWLSKGYQTIKNIEESPVTEDVKELYIAQIEALQGWLAFVEYDLYGGVPIPSAEILDNPDEEVYIPRKTQAEMVSYIETKLTDAAVSLPYSYSSSDWGRITKGAAQMILLKLYMQEKDWVKAEDVARELMKSEYGYALEANYEDIFSITNEQNNEVILAIPCNIDDFKNGWISHVLPPNYPYENTSAQKWGGYRMEWDFYNTFEAGDERLNTIVAEYTDDQGVTYNQAEPGANLVKGALPLKFGVDPAQTGHGAGNDYPVYRYSDLILCFAEAVNNNNGGPTAEAYKAINDVRNRVGLADLATGMAQDDFNDAILFERGHELYCEGHRRQDLIRHGKYIEYAQSKLNNQTASYKVLFPIPNSAIVEGKGEVKQNDGY